METLIEATPFTPISATIGGAMIGAAAVLLMASLGRISGISGIVANAFGSPWRIAFVFGLLTPGLVLALSGAAPPSRFVAGPAVLVLAGVLVGFGTRLGSGCTSGHGVCGLARLSPRSMAAVATFMAVGVLTASTVRHLL